MKSNYEKRKAKVREMAIQFQCDFSNKRYSWWDIVGYTDYLYQRAKKVGLVKELKREGII